MSPTATASEAGRRRTRFAPRWLVVTHRYLGIVFGALMLVWCLSGFVMLFVHWPQVTPDARAAGLAPIPWTAGRHLDGLLADGQPVEAATVEDAGGIPVLRLRPAGEAGQVFDLRNSQPLAQLDRKAALDVAGIYAAPGGAWPVRAQQIERDQWTVTGQFRAARPLWRIRLSDRADTDLYISARTGELVQRTTAADRVLNWFGAIPHWLYPAVLRQDAKLWSQVVIWTSLAGVFLTVVGLYLGLVAWRPGRRLTPFRGLMAWHHVAGLFAGVLTLTWVASGLVSMNPWGFLESPPDPAAERIAGPPPAWGDVCRALDAVASQRPVARQVKLAPLAARVFLLADGRRFDAMGRAAPLMPADLAAAGRRLGPVREQGMIAGPDAYYFPHHESVRLPAWRAITLDGRRYYLDPGSGELLASVDGAARDYRWLHLGLHRLDVVPGLDRGPVWAAVTALLLAFVTLGVATGVWLAVRRAIHDLRRLRRPSPTPSASQGATL
jgi:hypothetical protein